MDPANALLFNHHFLTMLKSLIELHHSIYPRIPPQGIFFESLVEQAFKRSGVPATQVVLSTTNSPQHDLLIGTTRISLKTETGLGTNPKLVNITKLCTTETGSWESNSLIEHALKHLSKYEHMLMLRAIWRNEMLHYQLVEIPLDLLKLMANFTVSLVGKREGRKSMATDIYYEKEKVFRVHFDGADGKCQIHRLPINYCHMLLEWDQPLST
jgi:hypothetical protein